MYGLILESFIYVARKKDYSWRHYLPRAKSKRGWRGRKGGSPASFIHLRRPLAERPKAASDRHTPGHWEADLMLFRTYGQAILTLHERYSRILIAVRPPGKAASPIASAMAAILAPLPTAWRQTITFDKTFETGSSIPPLQMVVVRNNVCQSGRERLKFWVTDILKKHSRRVAS